MKTKHKVTTILFLLLSVKLFSQGMFFTIGSGYGFAIAQNNMAANYTANTSTTGSTYTYENVKGSGSFAKGISLAGTVGHMFTKHIGAELNIDYMNGSKIEGTRKSIGTNSSSTDVNTMYGKMLRFIPSMRFQIGTDKFDTYMRNGFVIGTACKVTQTEKVEDDYFGTVDSDVKTQVYSGGLSLGFSCGIGFIYKFSHLFGIFGEGGFIMQSWAPKTSKYTTYTHNGTDQLPVMTTFEKQKQYVNDYNETFAVGTPQNYDVPEKVLKKYLPFSSAGITFGVRFHLGAKEKETQADSELKTLKSTAN